jgi:hypothetical protein
MTEGSGTPQFFAAVNNLIAEDRAVEPLITGLINVSGLLANVAACAIGLRPKGSLEASSMSTVRSINRSREKKTPEE